MCKKTFAFSAARKQPKVFVTNLPPREDSPHIGEVDMEDILGPSFNVLTQTASPPVDKSDKLKKTLFN